MPNSSFDARVEKDIYELSSSGQLKPFYNLSTPMGPVVEIVGRGEVLVLCAKAEVLPVAMLTVDDRLNCDHPVLLRKSTTHPITDPLPFADRPPFVGGFNQFTAKSDGIVLLEADRLECRHRDGDWQVRKLQTHPMLVVGQFGQGRTAAIATDAAPHWVGGFVDWGDERVQARGEGAEEIEVGNLYAAFWKHLVSYLSVSQG